MRTENLFLSVPSVVLLWSLPCAFKKSSDASHGVAVGFGRATVI